MKLEIMFKNGVTKIFPLCPSHYNEDKWDKKLMEDIFFNFSGLGFARVIGPCKQVTNIVKSEVVTATIIYK